MKIGMKLQELRKAKNLSQEELAEMLGVSRQAVYKWEQDLAYPETEKLIKLSELYNVTIDSLIKPNYQETPSPKQVTFIINRYHYEYKSQKTIFGLPLVHINLGNGFYKAKGFIAIGNIAQGAISLGLLSLGIVSFGVLGIGLIALGAFSLGLILAFGAIAIGAIALGAIAIGLFSVGAVAVGLFSVGALSSAQYVALGDYAYGFIAIGKTEAQGTYAFTQPFDKAAITQVIDEKVPGVWKFFSELIKRFLK